MPLTESTGGSARPSDRTIALAISVVVSKPEELTIREYIELLRRHIAKGRRDTALSSTYRHLDRSSFWRSEYERIKDALKDTEGRNVDLRIENDHLKTKLEKPESTSPAKKRKKKPDEDVILVPRSPKKQKQVASPAKACGAVPDVSAELGFTSLGEIGNIFLRSFYDISAHLKTQERTEPNVLAHHLLRATAVVPQIVHRAISQDGSPSPSSAEFLESVLGAATRSIQLLMSGINRISETAHGDQALSHITYAYVQMYSKLLDCLDTVSTAEADKSTREEMTVGKQRQVSPTKSKTKQLKQMNIKDNTALNLITKFLCGVIDGLDPKKDVHKSLFEGLAYFSLNKLGSTLHLIVFGYARGPSIEDDIATSTDIDDIHDATSSLHNPRDQQMKTALLEVPYLIHILTHVMNAAPAHFDAAVMNKAGKPKQAYRGSMKGALAVSAKERLQRTLVNCMFGEEGNDEDDPFRDYLKMPALNGPALPMPKIKESEAQEWFKEEVWRLLGWEILAKEDGW